MVTFWLAKVFKRGLPMLGLTEEITGDRDSWRFCCALEDLKLSNTLVVFAYHGCPLRPSVFDCS